MAFVISSRLKLLPPKQSEINFVYQKIKQGLRGGNFDVGITIPKETVKNIKNIESSLKRINSAARANNKPLKTSVSLMEDFADKTKLAFKRYSAFVIGTNIFLRLADALGKSVGKSFELQRELNKIAQVTDSSVDSTNRLKSQILELSQAYGISSLELAKSARLLRQAGLDARKTEAAMAVLAKTNLAPNFKDVETTTDDMIAIFKQFNLQANQLEKAFDAINYVASKYAIDAADVGEAVKKSGATFRSAGGTLEEYIATVTVIRDRTRESANVIGTSIKTIVARLQNANIQKFLRSEGIQLVDPKGDFIGPVEAFKAIGQELRGISSQSTKFSNVVNTLGGLRQVGRLIPLLTNPDEFAKIEDIIKNSTGSLANDVETALKTVTVGINKTKEAFDAFIDSIASNRVINSLLTTVLDITSAFLRLANTISNFPVLGEGAIATLAILLGGKALSKGFQFTKLLFKNEGGLIPGRGANKDTVPAMLTKGEFVMNRKAVDTYGPSFFAALNGYNKGGFVGLNGGGDPVKNYKQSGFTNDDFDFDAPSIYEDLHRANLEINKIGQQHLATVKILERVALVHQEIAKKAGEAAIAQLDAQKVSELKRDRGLVGPELYPAKEKGVRELERHRVSKQLAKQAERSANYRIDEEALALRYVEELDNEVKLKPINDSLPGSDRSSNPEYRYQYGFSAADERLAAGRSPNAEYRPRTGPSFHEIRLAARRTPNEEYRTRTGSSAADLRRMAGFSQNPEYRPNQGPSFSELRAHAYSLNEVNTSPSALKYPGDRPAEYRPRTGPSFAELRAHAYALNQVSSEPSVLRYPGEAPPPSYGPPKPTLTDKAFNSRVKTFEAGRDIGFKMFDLVKNHLPLIATTLSGVAYTLAQGYEQEGISAIKENRGINIDIIDGKVVGKTGRISDSDTDKAILGGVAKRTVGYTAAGGTLGATIGSVVGGIAGGVTGLLAGGVGFLPGAAAGSIAGGKLGAAAGTAGGALLSGLTQYDSFNSVLKTVSLGFIDISSTISATEKELEETRLLYAQEVQSQYEELKKAEANAKKRAALDLKNFMLMNRIIDLNAKFAEATAVSIQAFDKVGAYTTGDVTANRNKDLLSRAATGNIQTSELNKLYGLVGSPEDLAFGRTGVGTSTVGGGAATEATFIKSIPTVLARVLKSEELGNVESATDVFSKELDNQFQSFAGFLPQGDQYDAIKSRFVNEFSGLIGSGQTQEGEKVFGAGQLEDVQNRLQSASTNFIKSFELMHNTMEDFNDGLISLYDQRREVENQFIESINSVGQFDVTTRTKLKEFRGSQSSNLALYRSENLASRSRAALGLGFTPNSVADIRNVGSEISRNQGRLQAEQYRANTGQTRDAVVISSFKDAVNNGTRALKSLADSSLYLSQIEEEIGRERAKREQVGAVAERVAFGTREEKRELEKNARNVRRAAQYGLASIRREDRGGVLDTLNSLSEVQSADFGLDARGNALTGKQLKDKLIQQETGFSNKPQGREQNLIKEYERIATLSSEAQKELANIANTQVQFTQAIGEAIRNFTVVMAQTNWTKLADSMNGFPSHITGQFKHEVIVTFNGASVLKDMEGNIEKLVVGTFKREFNAYIKENLPEYPTV